jgi:arylsulfatase A-like enzyme/Flp pilus assembly protein TadD
MPKRTILYVTIAALLVTAAAVVWVWRPGTAPGTIADGPIVVISIDTLRADRLPAYGYTRIATPHIDRLVTDGVLFEQAYSQSPQTLPAHTSIFSGELPFEHGVRDNIGFTVKPGQRFLQHTLAERGYATGGFVSSYVLRRQTGFAQGFDTYDDELPPAPPGQGLGGVQRPGEQTIAAAIRWIDARESPRFFLFAHIYEPHTPYTPPARFAGGDPYDGEVAWSDEIVGGLVEHLRARDLYDRATIVLLSDHGEGLGDHGEDEHGIFLYRETIQIPLVIKLPGSRGAGLRVPDPVQQIDLLPTLLDLVGSPAASARGRSLRPVLERTGALAEAHLYAESLSPRYHFGWSELYALTVDQYRYIRAPRPELYDIAADPGERRSIADDRPQIRDGMARALDDLVAADSVTAPSAISEEERRKLAALGYVGAAVTGAAESPSESLADPKDKIATLRRYRQGAQLTAERRFDEAARVYRELLRDDPGMTDVWLRLAQAEEATGRSAAALSAYREVVSRSPRDPGGLTGAAGVLLRMGRFDDARAHAELAIDVAPAVAHELLARLAAHRGDDEAARRHASLAQEADPSLPMRAFAEALIAHRRHDYPAAARHAQEAASAMGGRTEQIPDVHFAAGDALARLERYPEAERHFKAELEISPAHLRARTGLAMLYAATGRGSEAARAIDDLVRHVPTPEGYEAAAQLWTLFGEPGRAAALRARAPR